MGDLRELSSRPVPVLSMFSMRLSRCEPCVVLFFIIISLPVSLLYPYNLTVYFNEYTDFEVYGAKLKLRLFGRNISEQIFLSKE